MTTTCSSKLTSNRDRADMERFFKVCVGQVVELIRGHMLQIEKKKGGRPKVSYSLTIKESA